MAAYDDDKDDKPERTEQRPESITDQLSFKSRFVFLFGDINHTVARTTCERLVAMAQQSDAPIRVLISSPGGHVESGDAIHDVIRFISAPVMTIGTGWVASAGTHIFLAAEKERRVCLPNTRFMIHQPARRRRRPGNRHRDSGERNPAHARAHRAHRSRSRPASPTRR